MAIWDNRIQHNSHTFPWRCPLASWTKHKSKYKYIAYWTTTIFNQAQHYLFYSKNGNFGETTFCGHKLYFLQDLDRDSLLRSSERVAREEATFKWIGRLCLGAFCTAPDSWLLILWDLQLQEVCLYLRSTGVWPESFGILMKGMRILFVSCLLAEGLFVGCLLVEGLFVGLLLADFNSSDIGSRKVSHRAKTGSCSFQRRLYSLLSMWYTPNFLIDSLLAVRTAFLVNFFSRMILEQGDFSSLRWVASFPNCSKQNGQHIATRPYAFLQIFEGMAEIKDKTQISSSKFCIIDTYNSE